MRDIALCRRSMFVVELKSVMLRQVYRKLKGVH
jgi:hypothetical protein